MKFKAFEPIDLKNSSLESIDLYLSQIIPDENQGRKIFREDSLEKLSLSIRKYGVIEPIIVETIESGKKYRLIAGERRWRAAKLAELEKIPAIVRKYQKPEKMAVALIENIQREDLNPLEEAQAIRNLLEECTMTHEQIAESISKSRVAVSNLLRLLNLEDEVKDMLNAGLLEMGHARALLSLSHEQQIETAKLIDKKKLSVRETEKLVQQANKLLKNKETSIASKFEKKAMEWKQYLSKQISKKVDLHFNSKGNGKVIIHFESIEEAELLIKNLQYNKDLIVT